MKSSRDRSWQIVPMLEMAAFRLVGSISRVGQDSNATASGILEECAGGIDITSNNAGSVMNRFREALCLKAILRANYELERKKKLAFPKERPL